MPTLYTLVPGASDVPKVTRSGRDLQHVCRRPNAATLPGMKTIPTILTFCSLLATPLPQQSSREPARLDRAGWNRFLSQLAKLPDKPALRSIATTEKNLKKAIADQPTAELRQRLAELLVRAKVPRVSVVEKGVLAMQAIVLLKRVLRDEPERLAARYTLARTCLALPSFFGQRKQGLTELKRMFRVTLQGGRLFGFALIDRALAEGQALAEKDAEFPLLRGLLRLWALSTDRLERTRAAKLASQAIEQFEQARRLRPTDTRIHGWLGPLLFITGNEAGLAEMQKKGRKEMDEGVRKNPEQNLFARALALSIVGSELPAGKQRTALLRQAEEDFYRTVEICTGERMDRSRFQVPADANARTDHPACGDPERAPHNRAGTFFTAGEVFLQSGSWRRAADAYEESLRPGTTGKWPFRRLAKDRLEYALARLQGKKHPGRLTPAPANCVLCHRTR